MRRSQSVDGLTIESLGLTEETYRWLTQTHWAFYEPTRGIRLIRTLLCCEATTIRYLPTHKPHLTPPRVREIERCLAANGKRLADPANGPCIAPPSGDEWVRLPVASGMPSWIPRKQLPSAYLYQVIGTQASILNHMLGVFTINGLDGVTARDLMEQVDWTSRNISGEDYLGRLNRALQELGLEPIR